VSFPRSGPSHLVEQFIDILKVGEVSASRAQSVLTIRIFTHMMAGRHAVLAGYGVGARLEFLLTSVAFATGIASVR